jgi:RNA polymerase sigma factor (TIGR02999 family)
MLAERKDHTLQGTALANEVFLRVSLQSPMRGPLDRLPVRWFFAAASTAIRQVVVDHARARARLKRGAGWRKMPIDAAGDACAPPERRDAILVVDELLSDLASISPVQAQIAQFRFFCGMNNRQIAVMLGIPEHQVRREWRLAEVWLGSRPAAMEWCP